MKQIKKGVLYVWTHIFTRYYPSFFKYLWLFILYNMCLILCSPLVVSGMNKLGLITDTVMVMLFSISCYVFGSLYVSFVLFFIWILFMIIGAFQSLIKHGSL